jgi:5'-methylthioinosine phosphorylase
MAYRLAIIGGSGVSAVASWSLQDKRKCETAFGCPSAEIETYSCAGKMFYFLPRHGSPHHLAPHCINYRANLRALYEMGVEQIIAINSVGGITAPAGALMIPDQIIDYTYGREHTFYTRDGESVRHVDFTEPYSQPLRQRLLNAAKNTNVSVIDGGVYAATQGPRLETAAEIRKYERDGCDIVGMTGMPEAALARELNIDYAALCIVVNVAAGKSDEALTVTAMQSVMRLALNNVENILQEFFAPR